MQQCNTTVQSVLRGKDLATLSPRPSPSLDRGTDGQTRTPHTPSEPRPDQPGPGLGHVTAALRCPAALRCGLAALRSYAALHTACTITCPVPGVSCPELAALAPALSEALVCGNFNILSLSYST